MEKVENHCPELILRIVKECITNVGKVNLFRNRGVKLNSTKAVLVIRIKFETIFNFILNKTLLTKHLELISPTMYMQLYVR